MFPQKIGKFGNIRHKKNANPLRFSVLDVPNFGNPRRERLSNLWFLGIS
jgi:hypothetical protein